MKALHFLRWPLILLLVGYLIFLVGGFSKDTHWLPSEGFVSAGYGFIVIAIVWIIIKFIFLKPPENDSN
jgi:hypothetical protein